MFQGSQNSSRASSFSNQKARPISANKLQSIMEQIDIMKMGNIYYCCFFLFFSKIMTVNPILILRNHVIF